MSKYQLSPRLLISRLALLAMVGAFVLTLVTDASAQQNVWAENFQRPEYINKNKAATRQSFPTEFKLFNLNADPLKQQLFSVVGEKANTRSTVVAVPNADGGIEYF